MHKERFQKYELQAKILKALAHPTRLLIVDELCKSEHCVCELTDMIGADMSTVSKHLSILKDAGIVGIEKRGTNVYYSLKIPCTATFLSCTRDVIKMRSKQQIEIMKE
jgi:DNA-binding transcriptional ArsR family regulator